MHELFFSYAKYTFVCKFKWFVKVKCCVYIYVYVYTYVYTYTHTYIYIYMSDIVSLIELSNF